MKPILAEETQARKSALLPATDGTIDEITEHFTGYDFATTRNLIQELADREEPTQSPTSWNVLFDELENNNCIAYYKNRKFEGDVYAIIWNREDGYEIAFADVRPMVDWVNYAQERLEERNRQEEEDAEEDETETLHHGHEMEKHRRDKKQESTSSEQDEKSTKTPDKSTQRIQSNIDKDTLLVLIAARVSGCLREDKLESEDYYHIVEGYPELDPLLQKITSLEALRHHEEKMPHQITEDDIQEIDHMTGDLNKQEEERKDPNYDRTEIELDRLLN